MRLYCRSFLSFNSVQKAARLKRRKLFGIYRQVRYAGVHRRAVRIFASSSWVHSHVLIRARGSRSGCDCLEILGVFQVENGEHHSHQAFLRVLLYVYVLSDDRMRFDDAWLISKLNLKMLSHDWISC